MNEEKTIEERKKIKRKSITIGGKNRYSKRILDVYDSKTIVSKCKEVLVDSFLLIQLMNLANTEDVHKSEKIHYPFKEFTLLSVTLESLLAVTCEKNDGYDDDSFSAHKVMFNGTRYMDPIFFKSVDVIEQFPKETTNDRVLTPEALSVFCFPDGVSIRLLPRCAIEGAKRLHWLGKDSDKYQLHAVSIQFDFYLLDYK